MNISSLVVNARADAVRELGTRLPAMTGVEVHGVTADGKMIVTIESADDRAASAVFEDIGRLPGVLSVALVFNQSETDPEREVQIAS